MTLYTTFTTELDSETVAKIMPPTNAGLVDVHTVERALNAPSGSRPRIYAYLERGDFAGQIVALRSLYDLERYETFIGFAWTSTATIADIIGRA